MTCEDTTLSLTLTQRRACAAAYASGISFAVFASPGESDAVCLFDDKASPILSDKTFLATAWLGKFADATFIRDRLTADQAARMEPKYDDASYPLPSSTRHDRYIRCVGQLITELKETGGKTVISTVITQHVQNPDIIETGLKYISRANAGLYRCLYYTPQTGCWIAASPELLLKMDFGSGIARTMALAGTRARVNALTPWDDKNMREQAMVRDFIHDILARHSDSVCISNNETHPAGNVEHIVTHIRAKLTRDKLSSVLDELSPTPALCGSPRDISIDRIHAIEAHDRQMYGGYFGLMTDNGIDTAVMLRCAMLTHEGWTAFAGGGITADSDPEQEWNETRIKAHGLYDFLTNRPSQIKTHKSYTDI